MINAKELKARLIQIISDIKRLSGNNRKKENICSKMEMYKQLIDGYPNNIKRASYQKMYCRFYYAYRMTSKLSRAKKIRAWKRYFQLLQEQRELKRELKDIIDELLLVTRRREVSYGSKLIATEDPNRPVIDFFVRKELDITPPDRNSDDFVDDWCSIYVEIEKIYGEVLAGNDGRDFVKQFDEVFPSLKDLTPVKKIDILLWQGSRLVPGGKKSRCQRSQR